MFPTDAPPVLPGHAQLQLHIILTVKPEQRAHGCMRDGSGRLLWSSLTWEKTV